VRNKLNIFTKGGDRLSYCFLYWAGGDIEMNKDQLIEKIHDDYSEKIYCGRLLDHVESYIRNYFHVVNEGIEKVRKYIAQEVAIEFDDRNSIASMRIKESSITFYRRQDKIDVAIVRNGNRQDDQIEVLVHVCKSRMYNKSIQEAMEDYMTSAFQ
jgi:hypothetical protein